MRKIHTVLVFLSLLVSPALSKDSQPARSGRASSATEQYLNAAADAVLNLKSAQFSLKREGTPAFLDEKNGITFTLAECSYAAPDRVSCNVKISLKNGTILQLTRVWVPEGVFQTNPLTRQFGKAPADASFNGAALFAKTGIADILRTATRNPQTCREGKTSREGHASSQRRGERREAESAGGFNAQAGIHASRRYVDGGKILQPRAGSRQRARGQRVAHRVVRDG